MNKEPTPRLALPSYKIWSRTSSGSSRGRNKALSKEAQNQIWINLRTPLDNRVRECVMHPITEAGKHHAR